jgi:tetratricopeptide (TPR) repeat protein
LAIDGLLVVAHIAWGAHSYWNLDKEHNLPSWYSGMQLGLLALAAFDCRDSERALHRAVFPGSWAWSVLGVAFLYLSLDEVTVIHEGVLRNEVRDWLPPQSLWISLLPWQIVFGPPLGLLALVMLSLFATRFGRHRRLLVPALAGLLCWGLAVLAEGLAKPIFMARGAYRSEVALEEGLELLGATLLLAAFARYAPQARAAKVDLVEVRAQLRRIALASLALFAFVAVGAGAVVAASLQNSAWLYRHNGDQLEKRGKCAEALAAFGEALRRNPKDSRALAGLARCSGRLGRYEAALSWYDQALAQTPNDARLWSGRAIALYRRGDLPQAAASFRRAVEIDPRYAAAWRNLGVVLAKLGQPTEAARAYRRALAANPHDERARRLLERVEPNPRPPLPEDGARQSSETSSSPPPSSFFPPLPLPSSSETSSSSPG